MPNFLNSAVFTLSTSSQYCKKYGYAKFGESRIWIRIRAKILVYIYMNTDMRYGVFFTALVATMVVVSTFQQILQTPRGKNLNS